MRIALITGHDSNFGPEYDILTRSKEDYCKKHGYDYHFEGEFDTSRPASWSKVHFLKKHLPNYDWVFWIDGDAGITNQEVQLETILRRRGDMLVSKDVNGLSACTFLLRNCPWAYDFLDRVWNCTQFVNHPWWEQAAMQWLAPYNLAHIRYVPKRLLNSYPDDWHAGDFVLHYAGDWKKTFKEKFRASTESKVG